MGLFNTVSKSLKDRKGVQYKINPTGSSYSVGDTIIELSDGIYVGHEGSFIVYKSKLVAVFYEDEAPHLFSKWGHTLPNPKIERII